MSIKDFAREVHSNITQQGERHRETKEIFVLHDHSFGAWTQCTGITSKLHEQLLKATTLVLRTFNPWSLAGALFCVRIYRSTRSSHQLETDTSFGSETRRFNCCTRCAMQ
jgi:hypothetical protein